MRVTVKLTITESWTSVSLGSQNFAGS